MTVVKLTGNLSGCVFALFLGAYIAMELLSVYPSNGLLWRVNIGFAREVRPLLEAIDTLAGNSTTATALALSGLAAISVASAKYGMRLLAASVCHIALVMVLFVVLKSLYRNSPSGLLIGLSDPLAFAAGLSAAQYAMLALTFILAAICLQNHVSLLSRAVAYERRRAALHAAQRNSRA